MFPSLAGLIKIEDNLGDKNNSMCRGSWCYKSNLICLCVQASIWGYSPKLVIGSVVYLA